MRTEMKRTAQAVAIVVCTYVSMGLGANRIMTVEGPTAIGNSGTYTVTVTYESDIPTDLIISLKDPGNGWQMYGKTDVSLAAGGGTAEVEAVVTGSPPDGSTYAWTASLCFAGTTTKVDGDGDRGFMKQDNIEVCSSDKIVSVDGPLFVAPGELCQVSVTYHATGNRSVYLSLIDTSNAAGPFGKVQAVVGQGQGTLALSIAVSGNPPPGSQYAWEATIDDDTTRTVTGTIGFPLKMEICGAMDIRRVGVGRFRFSFSAFTGNSRTSVRIMRPDGRVVASYKRGRLSDIVWDAGQAASGVYVVNARVGRHRMTSSILVSQ